MLHFFSVTIFILGIVSAEVNVRRPLNGIGNLLVSEDDKGGEHNKQRLMIFFDMNCMSSNEEEEEGESTSISGKKQIDYNEKQHSTLNSIMRDHYPCLSHTKDNRGNINHYQFEDLHLKNIDIKGTDTLSFGISFLDIKDATSIDDNSGSCLHNPSVQLNYNEHCISLATYEPVRRIDDYYYTSYYKFNASATDWSIYAETGYTCITETTNNVTTWGLDAITSYGESNLDDTFMYPNMYVNGTYDDNGVDLYIVDSGVRSTHDEFYSGQVTGDEPPAYVSGCNSGFSHGTHVAGIAGGDTVGHSRNLAIISYRVCDCAGACFSSLSFAAFNDIYKTLATNTRRGVINYSVGGGKDFTSYIDEYFIKLMTLNGGVFVTSAGNSYDDACDYSPAFSTHAITVGAANRKYESAWFSNYGSCVDIYGPGANIYSALANNDTAYASWSGTSMSSPAIAGEVANLLWLNPTLTSYQIKQMLQSTTTPISGGTYFKNDVCSIYDCQQYVFNCSNYYPFSTTPEPWGTTDSTSCSGYIPDFGCNYVAVASIDRNKTSTNLGNYFVTDIDYHVTDTCISTRTVNAETHEYSYLVECVSDETASIWTFPDTIDCTGNSTYSGDINCGDVIGNDWFFVDCSYANTTGNEFNIITRYWFTENKTECEYNESSAEFIENNYLVDACYGFTFWGDQYSYTLACDESGTNVTANYYYGLGCDGTYVGSGNFAGEGCFASANVYHEFITCGDTDYTSTTSTPGTTSTSIPGTTSIPEDIGNKCSFGVISLTIVIFVHLSFVL